MKNLMASKLTTVLYALTVTFIGLSIIISPKDSVEAALNGLKIWGSNVFPSLFPFFVVSEIMIALGVVNFIGVLLEPLMRPLFRVPGVGGFVFAMGVASGFPAGAKFTSRLRQEKQLTSIEAERLVTFTNSSNPLFMGGAIAVGFFHNATLAVLIMASHYLGNLLVGLTMRFHGKRNEIVFTKSSIQSISLKQAFSEMHQKRINNKRTLGKILGDAVNSATQTLLMVGGFIILFSVLNNVLSLINVTQTIALTLGFIITIFSISAELSGPFFSGLLEITNGAQLISDTKESSLFHQMIVVSFILGFNGFSIQAQVASFLAEAQIRFWPYFVARILHGLYAAIFTILLWKPLNNKYSYTDVPTTTPHNSVTTTDFFMNVWSILNVYGTSITVSMLLLFIILKVRKTFI